MRSSVRTTPATTPFVPNRAGSPTTPTRNTSRTALSDAPVIATAIAISTWASTTATATGYSGRSLEAIRRLSAA